MVLNGNQWYSRAHLASARRRNDALTEGIRIGIRGRRTARRLDHAARAHHGAHDGARLEAPLDAFEEHRSHLMRGAINDATWEVIEEVIREAIREAASEPPDEGRNQEMKSLSGNQRAAEMWISRLDLEMWI